MIIPILFAAFTLLDTTKEGHSAKITLSDIELRLNEPLQIEIMTDPPIEDIWGIKRALMAPNPQGISPLFLISEQRIDNQWQLTYMPQAAGHYTLRLPPITWEKTRIIPPLISLLVESSPRYEGEALQPAPPLPLEPGDPLELDEGNRKLLTQISLESRPSLVLEEHQFPWEQLFALMLFAAAIPLISAYHRYLNRQRPVQPLSVESAIEQYKRIPQSKGKESLDQLHQLMCEAIDPRYLSMSAKEIAKRARSGEVSRFFVHLEEARFKQANPDPKPFFQAAEQLFSSIK
jgi:hypothetical protein